MSSASLPLPKGEAKAPSPDAASSAATGALAAVLQQRVWLRVRRRRAWLERTQAESADPRSGDFFKDVDDPGLERWWQEEGEGAFWGPPIRRLDAELAGPLGQPLQFLAQAFVLGPAEMDLLQTCIVQQLDPALGPALACLHGQTHQAFVSGPAVARLFGHDSQNFWHPLANVRRWQFVQAREAAPGEPTAFEADPLLAPWLEGSLVLDPCLAPHVRRLPVQPPLAGWPVDAAVKLLEQVIVPGQTQRLVILGPPQSGRATCAAVAAERLGMPAVAVDTTAIPDADWDGVFLKMQRFAVLGGVAVVWTGSRTQRRWPRNLECSPIQIVTAEVGDDVAVPGWSDLHLELPAPTIAEKATLWRHACAGFDEWPEAERSALSLRYQLSLGQIAAIGRMRPRDGAHAIELAREATRTDVGSLGQFLACPFAWEDLVLPEALLHGLRDLACEAACRAEFWEQPAARRLFPRGRGVTALLSGTPGTGKTMAAQVIAAELQMDLFRVDLARVVSKYIGETAKHLSEVFARASRMSAILLFDEADALFAKRTEVKDAHDRYANADTSYLLQLLEEFQGLALLTTNKRGNIDPAFYRRLRYVFEFPKPGAAERLLIWQRLAAALFGEASATSLEPTFRALAANIDLSPAQIKGALLAGAFIARRRGRAPGADDLVRGLERELAKEGRALDAPVRHRCVEPVVNR